MCYSKEVSFLAGSLMTTGIAYTWYTYLRNNVSGVLTPVYKNILIGYFCIALHQYGDFLSILTGNVWIYRLGLVASISCMYFYQRALEKLSKLDFSCIFFLILIALCSIQIFFTDFKFENLGFWVRGDDTIAFNIWSSLWLGLFIYWNTCILYFRKINTSIINKKILIYYSLYSLSISFILYILYSCFSLIMHTNSSYAAISTWPIFVNFDFLKDSPSIWCALSVVQVFFIPRLFAMMNEKYDAKAEITASVMTWKIKFQLLSISLMAWLICILFFPFIFGAALKMVTS